MSEHAIRNAKGWLATICTAVSAYNALSAGAESVEFEGDTFQDTDAIRERIDQMSLSVEVRSEWHTPGSVALPGEFYILLSTGGPALRLIGELDENAEVYGYPKLQWQDWGTPWTDYTDTTEDEDTALSDWAQFFYYGE